ncbi:MAG: LON peptidase substrate-binding domain-containing protein [Phreatobacter sp.]|uniref:LON peptidase substrate-binding domain-containing protein n=1 Tax=Phreatobacter sp. TaxID=1966341 RepID=UPI001A38067F|nr:LON peptidase substrate-binding domain-containing protein [Phreatobacter sp.]MBL8570984.1 LON peptidase substrate-binding domain-containing protein [Phreatobacter sp.]
MALSRSRIASLADLPATIPVFPLPGVLLLPRGRLPLNIFEPRYLAMIDDALGTPDRLIGMIQPTEPEVEGRRPALYGTGCAGRVVSMSETDDGRYLITLQGVCRFAVASEVETDRGYRRVVPDFARWADDLERDVSKISDRARLIGALKTYFRVNSIEADWDGIEQTPDDKLLTTLAMVCPFEPTEKQALLECRTGAERAATMTALLEMGAMAGCDDRAKH